MLGDLEARLKGPAPRSRSKGQTSCRDLRKRVAGAIDLDGMNFGSHVSNSRFRKFISAFALSPFEQEWALGEKNLSRRILHY